MRKMMTLAFLCFLTQASAQYQLSGSVYAEKFDGLSSGLPDGWQIDTNAKTAEVGGSALSSFTSVPGTTTRWNNTSGGFKNVASANGFTSFASATAALQLAATDRALGIRQTATLGDPGAAFTLRIDHTFRLSDFEMDFRMQSLDSANGSKTTTWLVQYAIGDDPGTFTTISSRITTGGNTFSNIPYKVSFGSALDDIRTNVWIRIVTLTATSGSGSRTTSAIDDVTLRWKGTAVPGYRPLLQTIAPANGATDVPHGSILRARFSRNISLGTAGSLYVRNETDNTLQIISAGSRFLTAAGKELAVSGVQLKPSNTYHITFDSTIVDTAMAVAYSLDDTTAWRFTVAKDILSFEEEYFDTSCGKGQLPSGWFAYSASGAEEWSCSEHATGNSSLYMWGNDGTTNKENEDWLVSPLLDMRAPDAMAIAFKWYKSGVGKECEILVSHNYAGSGAPDSATWMPVSGVTMTPADIGTWKRYSFPLALFKAKPFHVGFRYQSSNSDGYEVRLDSFQTMVKTGITPLTDQQGAIAIASVHGEATICAMDLPPGTYTLRLWDMLGQQFYSDEVRISTGRQYFPVGKLPSSGLYIVVMENASNSFRLKGMISKE